VRGQHRRLVEVVGVDNAELPERYSSLGISKLLLDAIRSIHPQLLLIDCSTGYSDHLDIQNHGGPGEDRPFRKQEHHGVEEI
jgi:hypothetical protein